MSRAKGNKAEALAVRFLKNEKHSIKAQNFYSRFGEIDIITYKDDVYHFVEVKSGIGFEPIYNITPSKVSKILKTVDYYLMKNNITKAYCIDAIIIQDGEIDFIENITL